MKRLLLIICSFLCSIPLFAQVGHIVRHSNSYGDLPFEGSRLLQADEIYAGGTKPENSRENNVFLFSKIEKNARPDTMYFQRFTKKQGEKDWKLTAKKVIDYDGIIMGWDNRKGFADYDHDYSVDAFFIYSLADYDLNQQSVQLLFSKGKEIYEISSSAKDYYQKNTFSDNFESLSDDIKEKILEYWEKLDKTN